MNPEMVAEYTPALYTPALGAKLVAARPMTTGWASGSGCP